jgi:hypothetical protein
MKIQKKPTLADSICDVRARKIKKTFFTQINTLIDWDTISILIKTIQKEKVPLASLLMMGYCILKDSFTNDIPAKGVIVLLLFSTFIKIFTLFKM